MNRRLILRVKNELILRGITIFFIRSTKENVNEVFLLSFSHVTICSTKKNNFQALHAVAATKCSKLWECANITLLVIDRD